MVDAEAGSGATIRRYIKRYEPQHDDTDCEVSIIDRLTGEVITTYDGADPANNMDYLERTLSIDFAEEVDAEKCAVKPSQAEIDSHQRAKEKQAEREREEAEAQDLEQFIDKACDYGRWQEWERDIAEPALKAKGYREVTFYNVEADSFGPLIRGCVCRDVDGKRVRFFYG